MRTALSPVRGNHVAAAAVLCRALLAALAVWIMAPAAVRAGAAHDVLRVPDDFATIQGAVDAAAAGDVIQVAPGTYCEHVVIAKSDLRLHGAPADGATILSGECLPGGYGFLLQGTAATPITNIDISGFVVEGFDTGFLLQYVNASRLHLNEARANLARTCSPSDGKCAQGIMLVSSSFNEITQNTLRENGHLGLGLANASSYNVVRGNRLYDNQAQQAQYPAVIGCSLMLWGTPDVGNQIVENEVVGDKGRGIMIGSGASTDNVIAQNRVHGHAGAGIIAMGPAAAPAHANFFLQNDARGNATAYEFDLVDLFGVDNVWERNLGTCAEESGICSPE